jgi:hypothetical protein
MTLAFISGTRRSYLERKLLTDGRGLNKGNQGLHLKEASGISKG